MNLFPIIALWTLTLAWNAPTLNEGGTPINDLAGFKVYEDSVSNMTSAVLINTVTNGVNQNPSYGDTYQVDVTPSSNDVWFAVTSFDLSGNESSNSPSLYFTDETPTAPTAQITIIVNQ